MNAPLYTTEILRLAALLPPPHALDRVDGAADERSPTCGSTIRLEVQRDEEGRILALSQTVQACAFGQASASLLASGAPGKTREEMEQALAALKAWLAGESDDPGPWPGLLALAPARPKRGRHGAILLPFRAMLRALETAQ